MLEYLDKTGLVTLWNKIKSYLTTNYFTKTELEGAVIHTASSSAETVDYQSSIDKLLVTILSGETIPIDRMSEITPVSGTSLTAELGKYYIFDSAVNTLSVTLPEVDDSTYIEGIILSFGTGANPNVSFTASDPIYAQRGYGVESNRIYEINIIFNGVKWILSSIEINETPIYTPQS